VRQAATTLRLGIVLASTALALTAACGSKAAKVHSAPPGWTAYGSGVSKKAAVPVAQLLAEPGKYNGKTLAVEGEILGVCQNKGCWMTMQDGGKEMRVRFKDYAFFVPKDCAGKTARIEGVFAVEMIPAEDARHYLEDEGKMEEAAKITAPVEGFTFMASGVILHD
jgi:hypothetical protein